MIPHDPGLPKEWADLWRDTEANAEHAQSEATGCEHDLNADEQVLMRAESHLRTVTVLVLGWLRALTKPLPGVNRLRKARKQQAPDAARGLLAGILRLQSALIVLLEPVLYGFWAAVHIGLAQLALRYFGPYAWYAIVPLPILWVLRRRSAK
jgi:hypothetical protein